MSFVPPIIPCIKGTLNINPIVIRNIEIFQLPFRYLRMHHCRQVIIYLNVDMILFESKFGPIKHYSQAFSIIEDTHFIGFDLYFLNRMCSPNILQFFTCMHLTIINHKVRSRPMHHSLPFIYHCHYLGRLPCRMSRILPVQHLQFFLGPIGS